MERDQELMIIRAVNFCDMHRDKLKKIAIEKLKTIGEVYVELKGDDFNNFFTEEKMNNNLKLLKDQFEENKGQFVIINNEVLRFVCIAADDMDYYYVFYDGRKITWHSAVGSYIVLKNKIDEKDYNELVRLARINHFDQNDFFMPSTDEAKLLQKNFAGDHKIKMMEEVEYNRYLAPFCWDIN
jgi:hypothetical protein